MIVRADMGRGLAQQTLSFYRNLSPDVVVGVDMSGVDGARPFPFPQDFDAYPDAIWTKWRGYTAPFKNPDALAALAECDVVYTAETYYDERLADLCRTVLQVNPEFWRDQKATQYWYPTSWRTEHLPPGHRVPTPIEDSDITEPSSEFRLLHVGGHRAAADRNGVHIISGLLPRVRLPWRITAQTGMKVPPAVLGYVQTVGHVEDRWDLYEGCSVLVYPRRYGGQSLLVNEACARGLAVVMGDTSPNRDWPIVPIPARQQGFVKTPAGRLPTFLIQSRPLEETLHMLANNPDVLAEHQQASLAWARENAWSNLKPGIVALLEDAAS